MVRTGKLSHHGLYSASIFKVIIVCYLLIAQENMTTVVWHYFLPWSLNKKAISCYSHWDFSLYKLKCQTFVVIELHEWILLYSFFPESTISHGMQRVGFSPFRSLIAQPCVVELYSLHISSSAALDESLQIWASAFRMCLCVLNASHTA